jgi:hypothetical protein
VLFGRTSRPKLWSSINQYGRLVWTLCCFLFSIRDQLGITLRVLLSFRRHSAVSRFP